MGLTCINAARWQAVQHGVCQQEDTMFKHILVATDGSLASEHAVQCAAKLALTHGARISCLYVLDPYPYIGVGEANAYGFQAYMAAAQQVGTQALAKAAALCQQLSPALTPAQRLVEDAPVSSGIVSNAKELEADLIVVGSHGRTGLKRLMLGSVATKVVAESAIPVLVTR
jgi:nucleotide-binding universal stress UspA family protein